MQITDIGFILEIKKYSEKDAIVWIYSKNYGVYSGVVKSFQDKFNQSNCQIGNLVNFNWRARLEHYLGIIEMEIIRPTATFLMLYKLRLIAVGSLCNTLYLCLSERLPEENLYNHFDDFLKKIKDNKLWIKDYILLEILILSELGFGLDLQKCASNNSIDNLIYISPKTGKAVSKIAGDPYKDKLFILPKFFKDSSLNPDNFDILNGLQITSYFINKFILSPNNKFLCEQRRRLIDYFNKKVI